MTTSRQTIDRIIPARFGNTVIGTVVTRSAASGYHVEEFSCCNASAQSSSQQQQEQEQHNHQSTRLTTAALPSLTRLSLLAAPTTSAAETANRFLLRPPLAKRQSSAVLAQDSVATPGDQIRFGVPYTETSTDSGLPARIGPPATTNLSTLHQKPTTFRMRGVSAKSKACREQGRSNQARYRQKQREYVLKLELTVAKLRAETPMLEIERRRLHYGSAQRVWDVGFEYFRLFRYGVGDSIVQGSPDACGLPRASEAQKQLMFLRSTMAPDVAFGSMSGVEHLMAHWRRLSTNHDHLRFHLTHMDKLSESIVVATAVLSVTVTKSTLECVFSHLLESDNIKDLSLAVNLLGHRLHYPCSVTFVWDEESSLVERVETDIDATSPLLAFLGNLDDTSRVIERAVLAPSSLVDVARSPAA
ncbi:unnamed protein product [Hyaloperonospora brassicae]|uniref:BZIP domain-containing protein n=1 Tax=Hyaloperonospora brassicae TaxID=162125 RepID=A0AAV0V5D0_HYABA|nr:unnamed protein product [Hyaloperonospora brassicae]CAI5741939.1 unnamed protein product [Hyaloperonospora brassicae]